MAFWQWRRGRQEGGYEKLKLFESSRFLFDVYLIRFGTGEGVPFHVDPAPSGFQHHRCNITLRFPRFGGMVLVERIAGSNKFYLDERRIVRFRPDIQRHAVTRIIDGKRIFLSIGWLRRTR